MPPKGSSTTGARGTAATRTAGVPGSAAAAAADGTATSAQPAAREQASPKELRPETQHTQTATPSPKVANKKVAEGAARAIRVQLVFPKRKGADGKSEIVDTDLENAVRELALRVLSSSNGALVRGKLQRDLPYWTVYGMNVALFTVGIVSFIVSLIGVIEGNNLGSAIFGGLSAVAFIGTFISRPLQALQRNSIYAAWLELVVNTYWTKVVVQSDHLIAMRELEAMMIDAATQFEKLAKSQKSSAKD